MAAWRPRVGLHQHSEEPAAAERHVRLLPGGLSLRGRHLRSGAEPGRLPDDRAGNRGRVLLLAPEAVHDALLGLVPQPGWAVLQHEPPGRPLQRRLSLTADEATGG